jgi:hypothetical protein
MVLPLSGTSPLIQKLVIPGKDRALALQDLRLMAVSRASLIPGIEGLARSLQYRVVAVKDELAEIRPGHRVS